MQRLVDHTMQYFITAKVVNSYSLQELKVFIHWTLYNSAQHAIYGTVSDISVL